MKKNNLITGLVLIALGCLAAAGAYYTDTRLNNILFGFAGAGIVPGAREVFRYFYWNSPKHRDRYRERQEREQIELRDERKERYRDKSGRYAYLLGLVVIPLSIVAFSVLKQLDVVLSPRVMVIFLGGYWLFQIAAGIVFFRYLNRKY